MIGQLVNQSDRKKGEANKIVPGAVGKHFPKQSEGLERETVLLVHVDECHSSSVTAVEWNGMEYRV